jgi:hypothetical protein
MQLKELGKICRKFRIDNEITVKEIAGRSGYSVWNIYKFEEGVIDNASILLVYMLYGLQLDRSMVWQILTSC